MASLALGMAACTEADLKNEQGREPEGKPEEVKSNLTTVNLATFGADQSRVKYEGGTRAEEEELKPGDLKLVATIDNPSKKEGFNFNKEEGGRWLSATSIYQNEETGEYYITYHMQGNNYNTQLKNDIAGTIQKFTYTNGEVDLGNGFRAENPDKEDYDFNHLYFDKLNNRIIAVGHNWKLPSSWNPEEEFTGKKDNTTAIIGVFNPSTGEFKYSSIQTNEKAYDEEGKSLGYKDAGDANCVINLPNNPDDKNYYVATRKGLAVLDGNEANLFKPALNEDGTNYFIPTPGSCKFIYDTKRVGSMFDVLYLSDERDNEELTYNTSSHAKIAKFQTSGGKAGYYVLINPSAPYETFYDSNDLDIVNYGNQLELPTEIKPIDGKNAFWVNEDYEYYAPLGLNGLYYKFKGAISGRFYEGVLKFGNRPVNCVTMDINENGETMFVGEEPLSHDGFIYVANGAKLTILHRRTMEEIASYNIPFLDKDGNEVASSANYIHVQTLPKGENGLCERLITVAFGQAGVKIFRFMPKTKTDWEKEINSFN